ncbi:MAG: hypothetical protein P1Q69_16430 [Candidatus Thorarchaeota archaeon]|nr:hypothetical protein [Candidatus Thorarchaeota archaeon]
MKAKHILLMLVHLFRKLGDTIEIDNAVYHLAFTWRYGTPTTIRKLLAVAKESGLISVGGKTITAEFLYGTQKLSPNQAETLSRESAIDSALDPLY